LELYILFLELELE